MLVMGKESAMNATGMIITMAVFSVLTMVVFLWAKWSVVSRHWVRTRPWFVLFWCVLAALGALIPSVWIQEHMPELPNIVEGEFDMIMKDRWGYLVVGLLAPLAEEMVFRGAVLRSLLRWKENPWIGIVISAVLFAVIHMNPAQMPHAFLIGLLLGWLYYRTDSIVPGVVYHWVNNTVAYVMYNLYPNPDLTLVELFGTEQKVLMALGCSLLIFLPSLFQLNQRLNK
jgi:membrane protease YdiL (CAAX protease family)